MMTGTGCGADRSLWTLLAPDWQLKELQEMDWGLLKDQGIEGLLLDLDNTLIPWDCDRMPLRTTRWLEDAQKKGFLVAVISNNRAGRVAELVEPLGIPYVARAYKPVGRGFGQAAALLKLAPNAVAVVGDQLFTDILGGNRAGMKTVWVQPLFAPVMAGTRIIRWLERWAVKKMRERGFFINE